MTTTCPKCQHPATTVAAAAHDAALSAPVRATLELPAAPVRRTSGGLGCTTLALSFAVASLVSVIIGGVAEFTKGMNYPAQGMRFGETGVFSGIAAFIVVMVALFSIFVWRQARIDTAYKQQFVVWHRLKVAYNQDYYCAHCNMRWSPTPDTAPSS